MRGQDTIASELQIFQNIRNDIVTGFIFLQTRHYAVDVIL